MPVSENFEVNTNTPTPVIDADVTKVLNNIYSFLQKQQGEIKSARKEAADRDKKTEANNRAVQNALSDISRVQARQSNSNVATPPASNNRAVQAALDGILSGQRSSNVRNLAEDRRNRAVNNALFGKIDRTNKAFDKLTDLLKNTLGAIVDLLKDSFKQSIRNYDQFATELRKQKVSTADKKAAEYAADAAILYAENKGIAIEKKDLTEFMLSIVDRPEFKSMNEQQRMIAAMLNSNGMNNEEIIKIIQNTSAEELDGLEKFALKTTGPGQGKDATMALIKDMPIADLKVAAEKAGGIDKFLLDVQAQNAKLWSVTGGRLSADVQSGLMKTATLLNSNNIAGIGPEIQNLIAAAGNASSPEELANVFESKLDSLNKLEGEEREAAYNKILSQLFVLTKAEGVDKAAMNQLYDVFSASKQGTLVKGEIRTEDQAKKDFNANLEGGQLQHVMEVFTAKINAATGNLFEGGIFGSLAVGLDEMFGGKVPLETMVSNGFKIVISILSAMLASKIFKGPIDLLKKGIGGLLGAGATGAATGKTGGIIAKIGSAISKIVGPSTKLFPMLSKVAGVVFKFLGPIGWVITALQAGFAAGKWLVKTLFPGVYLTMQKAGGYIGALKEIGVFIKDKFMEFYTDSIQPLVEIVGGVLTDVVTNIWDGSIWFFSEKLPSLFTQIFDLGSSLLNLGSAFSDLVGSGLEVAWSYINIGITTIASVPTLICGKIEETYFTLKEFLLGKIKDLIRAINEIPGVNADDLENSLVAAETQAGIDREKAKNKQEKAIEEVATAVAEKDAVTADFDSKLAVLDNALDGVKEAANKVGDVDVTYEEYHKKKEEERDKERKELEAWEKKNANKSNGLLEQIAGNTAPEQSTDTLANLPGLADGGLINSTTPAIIGEAGREAVLPLTNPDELKKVLSSLSGSDKRKLISSLLNGDSTALLSMLSSGPQLPSANGVPGDDPATINKILSYAGPYRDMVYERMLHGWKGNIKDGFKQRKKWFDEALSNAANQEGRELIRGTYAEKALDYGVSELGKPYILRSLGKIGYVCNELVNACVRASGFDMGKFRVNGVKATFANINKGKMSGEGYPNFRIRDDLTPQTAIPGMVFFQDARKNREGGFQPGHIGLVYYGHQKLHSSGGSSNYTKEEFLPNWQTPCRGVTVTPFDGSNYVIGEFPGMFEQISGGSNTVNSSVLFGPGVSEDALRSTIESNMSSIEDAGLMSNEQISSVLANASGADIKLAASYAAEAAKLMNSNNKEEIIAILTEIARYIRGIAISKKPMTPVSRPAISTY